MRPRVYLETTVISYLTALPKRDIVQSAHRQITREWWRRRSRFDLFVSEAVLQEAARGDVQAAGRRLSVVRGIPVLEVNTQVSELAEQFIRRHIIPAKAQIDAVHIAAAVLNAMDYLLTWNCSHIANAVIRANIDRMCRGLGLDPPVICTPEELMESP